LFWSSSKNNLYLGFRRASSEKEETKTKNQEKEKIYKENCCANKPNEFFKDLNEAEYELKLSSNKIF
jgi:hypothetical protein